MWWKAIDWLYRDTQRVFAPMMNPATATSSPQVSRKWERFSFSSPLGNEPGPSASDRERQMDPAQRSLTR